MKKFLRSFSSLPLIYSRRVVVSYKRKYVHELLVNRLFKPAQENVWLGAMTIAVDLGRKATKQTNKQTFHICCLRYYHIKSYGSFYFRINVRDRAPCQTLTPS